MKEGVIPAQEIEYSGSGLFYEYPAILPAARNAGLVERSGSSCVWMVDEENECLVVGEQLEKMVMGKGGDLLRLGSEDTWVGLYFRRDRGSCEWSRVTLEQTLEGEGEVYVTGAVKRVYGDEKY